MSKRQEIQEHLTALRDIGGIMGAMKNLALMEIHKLARVLSTQQRVVRTIEAALSDVAAFHPRAAGSGEAQQSIYVVIGSERGFCGDFNERLVSCLDRRVADADESHPLIVAVGHKLITKLDVAHRVTAGLGGPSVAEEIQPVLIHLMETLTTLQGTDDGRRLDPVLLWHGEDEHDREPQVRRPFHDWDRSPVGYPDEPVLTLPPPVVLGRLLQQYLFAVLHQVFYSSLMAENRRRFQHMDQALKRLEHETGEWTKRHHVLRQREITEEIQVIMLSAKALGEGGTAADGG